MRQLVVAALVMLALAACARDEKVITGPTYVPAVQIDRLPSDLPPPREPPPPVARETGARAVSAAANQVVVRPKDYEIRGTTWTIGNALPTATYEVYVRPFATTTILMPQGETVTAATIGSQDDFTVVQAISENRGAIILMPRCAAPKTERFAANNPDRPFLGDDQSVMRPCSMGRSPLTVITSGGLYLFDLVVTDWTEVRVVSVNHSPPPKTNNSGAQGRPPFPKGQAEPLRLIRTGDWNAPWIPIEAWADPEKMVLAWIKPLPELPVFHASTLNNEVVNYAIRETDDRVYLVTDRRITEGMLRVGEEQVEVTSGRAGELKR